MPYDWDPAKAAINKRKHLVAFDEAATVFDDQHAFHEADSEHSVGEERFRVTGESQTGKLLVVAYADRGDHIRLISARAATRSERRHHANRR